MSLPLDPSLELNLFTNHRKWPKSVRVYICMDLMYSFTERKVAPVYKQKQVIYGVYEVHGTTITVSVTLSNQANAGLADCQESWPAFSRADGHSHYDRTQTAREHMWGDAFFLLLSFRFYHSTIAKTPY